MSFKFRLETSFRLAKQEVDIAQGLLAKEMRIMQEILEKKKKQEGQLAKALAGQKKACLEEPLRINIWQKYAVEQKDNVKKCDQEVQVQEEIVLQARERLMEWQIKLEKFKRLKQKKLRLFNIQELKQDQAIIDEIAQRRKAENSFSSF